MLKESKKYCNHLTIALHEDPSIERSFKMKPIQNVAERKEILLSFKYVDEVRIYNLEKDFLEMLKEFDIRFLGEDYKNGNYTGKNIPIEIIWIDRSHHYSTTKLKKDIYYSLRQINLDKS